jgi:murein DD-endopeptidase MepM/ murein hydrolase activator NlpD
LTKAAGAGRFLTAVVLALFTFGNVSSAKSRVPHRTSKDQSTHRQSRAAHKTRKERAAGRQSRIAHKSNKEQRADRRSRLAYKTSKNQRSDRRDRIARTTRKEQPISRQSQLAKRTNVEWTNKKQPAEKQNDSQIVGGAQRIPSEPKASSVQPSAVQTQKSAEPEINPDLENAVIPPAPVVVKRKANAIMIPVELADSDSTAKSDSKTDSKPESKYEERPAVSSAVSVGSSFGYRRDPFTRRAKFHSGVDLKAHWGDAVGASQAGTVQFAGWHHGYGNMIIVDHGGGVTTQYAHLSSFDVEPGDHVERGTIIGRAGSTGRATSPHLHYEVRIDGTATDPLQPLALDPSSDYFKLSRPTVDTGRANATQTAGSSRDK